MLCCILGPPPSSFSFIARVMSICVQFASPLTLSKGKGLQALPDGTLCIPVS